jgi:hypothetical protein
MSHIPNHSICALFQHYFFYDTAEEKLQWSISCKEASLDAARKDSQKPLAKDAQA